MQGLAAVANSKTPTCPPARRPGRQFGRMQNPVYSQLSQRRKSRSPPPTPSGSGARKVVNDELKELDQLSDKLLHHRAEVLNDTFDSLPADSQCEKLENADAFVKSGLARIAHFEGKRKARAKMAAYRRNEVQADSNDTTMQEKRDSIVQSLKALHVEICALYAPLLAERPLVIDAGKFSYSPLTLLTPLLDYIYHSDFLYLDQINQVLVLLAVICNMVIGLSTLQCDFLIGVATMCVKLGMSTVGSCGSSVSHSFSPSQNEIIRDMPSSLSAALKKFGADGRFDLYATCTSCSCTHKARSLPGPNLFDYPDRCTNQIVGKHGVSICGSELLTRRRDGTMQPLKPLLVSSLPDYLTHCLSDETYLQQSVAATDMALHAIHIGEEQIGVQSVFEANFIKDFKGPDGKLFVD